MRVATNTRQPSLALRLKWADGIAACDQAGQYRAVVLPRDLFAGGELTRVSSTPLLPALRPRTSYIARIKRPRYAGSLRSHLVAAEVLVVQPFQPASQLFVVHLVGGGSRHFRVLQHRVVDEDAADVVFACVCLRASISYAIEAAYWCAKAKR